MTPVPNSFDSPDFRRELGEMFDEKLTPILEVQKTQSKILAKHDRDISTAKGAWKVISAVCVAIVSALFAHVKRMF